MRFRNRNQGKLGSHFRGDGCACFEGGVGLGGVFLASAKGAFEKRGTKGKHPV